MIKPEEFNFKLEELQNDYKDLYDMFDYLNNSRDGYISENIDLSKEIKILKTLCVFLFICWFIEFILFLFAVNL